MRKLSVHVCATCNMLMLTSCCWPSVDTPPDSKDDHVEHQYFAGLASGARVRLLASASRDVAALRNSKDLPGLAGFEREDQRAAARRRAVGASAASADRCAGVYKRICHSDRPQSVTLSAFEHPCFGDAAGPYTFQRFQTWEQVPADAFPSPTHAMKLLQRLAADRGIIAVMSKY